MAFSGDRMMTGGRGLVSMGHMLPQLLVALAILAISSTFVSADPYVYSSPPPYVCKSQPPQVRSLPPPPPCYYTYKDLSSAFGPCKDDWKLKYCSFLLATVIFVILQTRKYGSKHFRKRCRRATNTLIDLIAEIEPPITRFPTQQVIATRVSRPSNLVPILKPGTTMKDLYDLGGQIGRSRSGITRLCTQKATGLKYACKCLSRRIPSEEIKRHIAILKRLAAMPNITEAVGAYEDMTSVYLVTELCSGCNLFDAITRKGRYYEKDAARIGRQIVNVVHDCHMNGVMHRDIMPENFSMAHGDEDFALKATDFSLSVFIEEGKVYRDIVGNAFYVAPEVLKINYGKEIDVWSAGVIIYTLLCGSPPFFVSGGTEDDIFEKIAKGRVDLQTAPWPSISESGKGSRQKDVEGGSEKKNHR